MTIPFKNIPQGLLVPLFYAELDPSRANTAAITQRALVLGQKTSAGTYPANTAVRAQALSDVKAGAGLGSMVANMYAAYRANDQFNETWVLPVADDASGTAATGSLAMSGTTTTAGTISLYIAGQLVSVNVASGATATVVAAAVRDAITAASDLPVTATTSTATVNLVARHKGLVGNDIDIRLNYLGSAGGEVLPPGLTIGITAMSGGVTNPTLTAALASLGDLTFDFIVSPYTDATSIAAITALLNDSTGRWSWSMQAYGHCFIAKRDTASNLGTFGLSLNDQHLSVVGFNDSPSPNYIWAAAFAGAAAVSLRQDPGLPLQYLTVAGVLAPPMASRFNIIQRQTLLQSSVSTWKVDANGVVVIENMITTYSTNAQGQADNSYLQVETMFLHMLVLRRLSTMVTLNFGRTKLASNQSRPAAGTNVTTPNIIRANLIAHYRQLEAEGYVQNSDAFAAHVVVEKDPVNTSRINVLYPDELIDAVRVMAFLIQPRHY